jgi:hypothetical protein
LDPRLTVPVAAPPPELLAAVVDEPELHTAKRAGVTAKAPAPTKRLRRLKR